MMRRNSIVFTRNIKGRRPGDHHQFKHPIKPGKVTITHPAKDIPFRTLKSIEKQAWRKF
jgi:predicted RNA binding protein YcfA (HicA-like mRNA interferase family)